MTISRLTKKWVLLRPQNDNRYKAFIVQYSTDEKGNKCPKKSSFYHACVYLSRLNSDLIHLFSFSATNIQFNIKLPSEVDEYYAVKEKCINAGWEPGKPPVDKSNANGPHRVMAQALMKRAIGDIPIVTFIQKESAGMNKLYSQSMCSVSQWRAYQNAETMVSTEVDEVRAEADEIEPGWSQVRIKIKIYTILCRWFRLSSVKGL